LEDEPKTKVLQYKRQFITSLGVSAIAALFPSVNFIFAEFLNDILLDTKVQNNKIR
jgi:hypothetical protein